MFSKTIFKNGLRIITVPEKKSRTVTVLVLAATGSKYEKKEINGISHFLEHLLFKGTKKRPTPIDIALPLDKVGGLYNAFTSEEYTGYFAKVSREHLDLALDIISDIYLNSKLDPKEIKKEKGVIIEEINMYSDHPSSYVQILWNKLLYKDQPAGWDIAGTKESVMRISRKEISAYMRSQYTASNTVISISGGVEKESALSKIKDYFSNISFKKPFNKLPVIENQKEPECILNSRKTDQTHFCLGVRGFNIFDQRRYAQEILAAILGGMMSSRLFVRVREELGLAYYIRTASSSETDTGCLFSHSGVDSSKVEKAVSEILKEYKKISKNSVPLSELKKAKDNLKGKMAIALETSDNLASFYGIQEILEKRILKPEEIYDKINRISARDVLRVAQEIFKPKNLNLAVIGPFDNKNKFLKLLKI
ncbi:MAG: pitrilysin family protein [Candidatus Pacebacteria bacterium]|nr:pitrilysin family protein [Candidatus Paceibacterota bacterium]